MLTSILKQGAEFNSLADTALADRYNSMLELVTEESAEGDFPIMMALINSVPPEYVVRDIKSSLHHPSRPTTRISTEI